MIRNFLTRLWPLRRKGDEPARIVATPNPAASDTAPPPDTSEAAIDRLKAKMRKTAQARFFGAKRLQIRDQKITRLTALSSAYLIGLTALPYFLEVPPVVENHVNLVTLIVAVIVLVSSLLQYSRLDVVSAEQHHRCGLEINEVLREFGGLGPHDYKNLVVKYNEILQKYSVNHDDVDFWSVTLDRPDEYPWLKGVQWLYRRVVVSFNHFGPDIVLAITTLVLLLFVVSYVLPSQNEAQPHGISVTISTVP